MPKLLIAFKSWKNVRMFDTKKISDLNLLVTSVIVILLAGSYYNDPFVIGNAFHSLRFLLYIFVPILLNAFYFHIPWKNLGISMPTISRRIKIFLLFTLAVVPLVVFAVRLSPDYLNAYPMYRDPKIEPLAKLIQFSIFTLSTLLGWELLLRAFLLFGLRYILEEQNRMRSEVAISISILWVCTFEVLYHFQKPHLEAIGMLIASPILSWLAFKTRSFVVPLLLHLYIEFVFIFVVIFS